MGSDKSEPSHKPSPGSLPAMAAENSTDAGSRRNFVTRFLALIVGGIVAVFPAAVGLAVFLDPLRSRRKKTDAGTGSSGAKAGFLKVAPLDALPVGGDPRQFKIIDDRADAWNVYPNEPIGAVYLQRTTGDAVLALNVVCPHAGCFVDFDPSRKQFQCPCHDSSFHPDGRIANERSPSARALDSLEVDLDKLKEGEVWVRFQNFRRGTIEKIPEA